MQEKETLLLNSYIRSHGGIGYTQKAEEVYEIIIMTNDNTKHKTFCLIT